MEESSQKPPDGPNGPQAGEKGMSRAASASGVPQETPGEKLDPTTGAPGKGRDRKGIFAQVHALVRRIPRGCVMTYGDIAAELGNVISPLAVGWALHRCPDDVPWQRVVNAVGRCSTDEVPGFPRGRQRAMLQAEGIAMDEDGFIELGRYRWRP